MKRKEQIAELVEGGLSHDEAIELVDRLNGRTSHDRATKLARPIHANEVLSRVVSNEFDPYIKI